MKKKVSIIGAGIGGLATAALLAKDGYDVHVYEKNEQPGGRASFLDEKGFKFDMGPSWLLMPDVFEKFFNEFDIDFDKLNLKEIDPQYRVIWNDGDIVDIPRDIKGIRKIFESYEAGSGKKLQEYLAHAEDMYNLGVKNIIYKNYDSVFNLFQKDLLKNIRKFHPFISFHREISKYIKNKKLQQLLEYSIVFLGCSPYNAPSIFSLMNHSDYKLGVYYPMGGMKSIVDKMVDIGENLGVKYTYNCNISKIFTKNDKVVAIKKEREKIKTDILTSNADYKFTDDILDDQTLRNYSDKYWRKKVLNPSAFILYLGVKGKLPNLLHHNLLLNTDWDDHFDNIFGKKKMPTSPSIYVNVPSKTEKSFAPKGHHSLMILVPTPPGMKLTNEKTKEYRDTIINYIEKSYNVSLNDKIIYEKIFSGADFTSRYNSYQGNAFGGIAHTLTQSLVWRPKNKNDNLTNMYYVGAGTTPGIGVPAVIVSAHLIRDRIENEK